MRSPEDRSPKPSPLPLPLVPEVGPALLEGVLNILRDQRLTPQQRLELAEWMAGKAGELYGPRPSPRGGKQ